MDIAPHDRLRLATEARCSLATVESWAREDHVSSLTALALAAAAAHLEIDTGRPPWPTPGWRGDVPSPRAEGGSAEPDVAVPQGDA